MKTLTLSFTFFLFLIIFTSCQKEEKANVVLPPTTQNGSFTLGCLVNSVPWIPRHYSNSLISPPSVLSSEFYKENGNNLFNIHAKHWKEFDHSNSEILSIYIENSFGLDTIKLDNIVNSGTYLNFIVVPPSERPEDLKIFQSIGNADSWLVFSKFDTINRIASGTFSSNLVNEEDSLDSLKIRQGTFDVRF